LGTSGWIYKHWRGVFYPERLPSRDWFTFYQQHFNTVEVNNTFYRLSGPEAFDAWKKQAAPGFCYALKASRFLTHRKKLNEPEQPLELLLSRARRLGRHLGRSSTSCRRIGSATPSGCGTSWPFCRAT
jgi:uncharacterized protein YecE (DUF72 family)